MNNNERLARAVGLIVNHSNEWAEAIAENGTRTIRPIDFANDPAACATWVLPWLESKGPVAIEGPAGGTWDARIWFHGDDWLDYEVEEAASWAEAVTALALAVLDAEEESP